MARLNSCIAYLNIYSTPPVIHTIPSMHALLRPNLLQRLRDMHELIRIRLRNDPPLVRLLHEKLIPLLVREPYRILLRLEAEVGALHEIRARLPAH